MNITEKIINQLSDRICDSWDQKYIFTPVNIVKKMIDNLPEEVWNPDRQFLLNRLKRSLTQCSLM